MDKINSPIPIGQRDANFLPLLWLWASGNVLLASFLVGSYYAFDLGVAGTIWISITANAFAYIICALSCQKSARYGLDEVVALRPTFGMKGASIGGLIIFLITCGWVGILSSMTGSAATMIMSDHLGVSGFSGDYGAYALLIGIVIPLLLIAIKPSVGFKLFSVAAPIMILFALYMLWRILTTNRVELGGIEQGATLFGASLAIELCFAYAIAWLPYLGAWSRFATSERSAYWASFLGLAVVGTLFAIVGGAAIFAGPIVGALLLVGLETWASGVTDRWVSILGLTYILSMLYLPEGVLGLLSKLWRRRRGPDPATAGVVGVGDSPATTEEVA